MVSATTIDGLVIIWSISPPKHRNLFPPQRFFTFHEQELGYGIQILVDQHSRVKPSDVHLFSSSFNICQFFPRVLENLDFRSQKPPLFPTFTIYTIFTWKNNLPKIHTFLFSIVWNQFLQFFQLKNLVKPRHGQGWGSSSPKAEAARVRSHELRPPGCLSRFHGFFSEKMSWFLQKESWGFSIRLTKQNQWFWNEEFCRLSKPTTGLQRV